MLRCGIALLLSLFFWSSVTWADIYKYVDENGVMHFTNTPTSSRYALYRRDSGSAPVVSSYSGGNLSEAIRHYSSMFKLEESLVHAVIKAESNYNPKAVSHKGALGVMQLMPETARLMKVNNPMDAVQNIQGGSRYLRQMLDEFNGNVDLALAAYNAGPNAVKRYKGIPPYEETQTYVSRVKKYMRNYRQGRGDVL